MQTRFLLGPAGSGKTFSCLAEIRAELLKSPEGPPLVLLAPKQATFQLERQLLAGPAAAGLQGYTRLRILSFDRLAGFVFDRLRIAPPSLLAEEGRVMVLRALLLRHQDELKQFRKSARRPGFAQELSQLLGELQQHLLTPPKLRALAQHPDLAVELRGKLHDLALLLDAYTNWLAEHELQDANCLLDLATGALRGSAECGVRSAEPGKKLSVEDGAAPSSMFHPPSSLRFAALWLDGFAEMTPQELDLLAAVLPFCDRATLAFCLDEAGAKAHDPKTSWLSVWSVVRKSFRECQRRLAEFAECEVSVEPLPRRPEQNRFERNPALAHLEARWADPIQNSKFKIQDAAIRLIECPNPDAEATLAAREILRFVRDGGRFRDAAVLVRDLEGYHKPLERAFRRYDIPFFLDRRESVSHHPLAELTRSALRTVVFDWPHEDWFAALKAGFSPVDETEIDRLENEALARGWRGAKWREPLQIADNPALAELLERVRGILVPPFVEVAERLESGGQKPTGEQLAEVLRDFWENMRVEQRLTAWVDELPDHSQSALHATVWDQMNAWLDNLALAFPRESLSVREWVPILEAGLATLEVGVIPPALDQVLIGAIDRSRNSDLKLALVLGVNESIFPAAPAAPTILTDADRDELTERNVMLGPDLRDRLARERYYGYIACTRASQRLVVAYSRHDAEVKKLNPSPFVAQLQRLFPGLEPEKILAGVDLAKAEHASELAAILLEIQKSQSKIQSWEELLRFPPLAKLNESLRRLKNPDPSERLSPGLVEALYGPVLRTSVSRLETFAACPFRFFVHSGLRAEERKHFELDAREQGSFQHDVLRIFHEELESENKRWRDLTPLEARERVGRIAGDLMARYRDGLLRDSAQTRFTARVLVESLQDFIEVIVSWMRGQYEFDPAAVELEFGGEGGVPAWEIDLGNNHKLALRGRIDRIDLWREAGTEEAHCVVLDYKSSQKQLDPVLVAHGVQLQLLAYLSVLRHWSEPFRSAGHPGRTRLLPAGVFYVNLRGRYERSPSRTDALANALDARRRAYRHIGRFDASVLRKLDNRPDAQQGDQFNYWLNKDGALRANSVEALPGAEFEKLLARVESQLQTMGRQIVAGEAGVSPYRKGQEIACDHCDYRAVCRFDPWVQPYRVLGRNEQCEEVAPAS